MPVSKIEVARLITSVLDIDRRSEAMNSYLVEKVSAKLTGVLPDDIVRPSPLITIPLLAALSAALSEPVLCDLYSTLLATAMDKNTARDVQPGFVSIIQQLASDEAKILIHLTKERRLESPVINLISTQPDHSGEQFKLRHFSLLGNDAGCQFAEYIPVYLENLCRLGLAQIESGSLSDNTQYDRILDFPFIIELRQEIQKEGRLPKVSKHIFSLTNMGMLFSNVCIIQS